MYCGLSASGKGLFCIVPYADYTGHRGVFKSLECDFEKMGINIDKSCIDECRLQFYSYDENPYINRNAENYKYDGRSSNILEYTHKQKKSYKTKPPKNPKTILIPNVIETFLRPSSSVLESATPLTKG